MSTRTSPTSASRPSTSSTSSTRLCSRRSRRSNSRSRRSISRSRSPQPASARRTRSPRPNAMLSAHNWHPCRPSCRTPALASRSPGRTCRWCRGQRPPRNARRPIPRRISWSRWERACCSGSWSPSCSSSSTTRSASRQDLLAAAGNSVPVMGVIPAGRSSRADVVSISAPQSPAAEAYRSLRTAVNFAQLKGSNCIEITSTRSRQGKTETLANLAVLAARAGQRVVVVDCDLRLPARPRLLRPVQPGGVHVGRARRAALLRAAAGARCRAALRAPVGSHPAQPVRAAGHRALPRGPRLAPGRRHPGDRRHAPCAHGHRRRRAGAVGRGHPHRRRGPGHPPEAGAPGARGLPSDLGPDPRPRALQRRQRRDRGLREGAGRRERKQARRRRTVEPPAPSSSAGVG